MDSRLHKAICNYIAHLDLKTGDKLPSIEQMHRRIGASRYQIYQELKEIAAERKYEVIHGSGIYLPGRKKIWKPFEYSIALISPGNLISRDIVNALHYIFMQKKLNLLPLNIPHDSPEYEEETLQFLLNRRIWGLIIEPHPDSTKNLQIIKRMQAQNCRCILLSHDPALKKRHHFFTLNYYALGKRAAEFAHMHGFRSITFIEHSPGVWHQSDVCMGVTERARELGVRLRIINNEMRMDHFTETWEWERDQSITFEPDTLYLLENWHYRASHLFNVLRRSGTPNTQVMGFTRLDYEIDPRFPCLYLNEWIRFSSIAEKILNTAVWAKTGVERSFEPELLMPFAKPLQTESLLDAYRVQTFEYAKYPGCQ